MLVKETNIVFREVSKGTVLILEIYADCVLKTLKGIAFNLCKWR